MHYCQDLARCCQHLNFGLNWTQGVKAKHCWLLSTSFLFTVQYKADTKQNMILSSLAEWMQKFKFLYTTGSWQGSTKVFLIPQDFNNRLLFLALKTCYLVSILHYEAQKLRSAEFYCVQCMYKKFLAQRILWDSCWNHPLVIWRHFKRT